VADAVARAVGLGVAEGRGVLVAGANGPAVAGGAGVSVAAPGPHPASSASANTKPIAFTHLCIDANLP
jgi:hypothetical protein